jgi:cytochrome P450
MTSSPSPASAGSAPRPAPPTVKGKPILGASHLLGPGMHRRLGEAHDVYGDLYFFRAGPARLWSVRDPDVVEDILIRDRLTWQKTGSPAYQTLAELLGQGLVTAEGPQWLKHRRLSQPAFHRERIGRFMGTMHQLAEDTAQRLLKAADDGADIDVAHEMLLFTQRVIGVTMLSIDLAGARGQALAEALDTGVHAVEVRTNTLLRLPLWVPTPINRDLVRTRRTLDELIYGLIAERRAQRQRGEGAGADGDLLDMLMDATDEDSGEALTDTELRDDVLTIFLAGHETTSNLLSWTFLALAQHPHIADALATELAGVDPLDAARPRATPSLLDRIVDESMRWRPPIFLVDRVAQNDTTIGPYEVKRGDLVLVNLWALHRSKHWPDPERFDPDRFLPDAVKARPKMSFLPFLAGNRKCIGDVFALSEAKIALATWLPRLRVAPTGVVGETVAVTLRPTGGMPSRVTRR